MIKAIKQAFYFPIAYYFRFLAKIRLNLWKPKIVVITGSSGKTTLLHLIESQIRGKAKYSHQANSSYGIPFDILELKRKTLTPDEWIYLFLIAPFRIFKKNPTEKIYIVEADCDRPKEGKFLAELLNPDITLWISLSPTHSANFDQLVKKGTFSITEEAIATEFGYFLEYTKELVIANGDNPIIQKQLEKTKVSVKTITKKDLKSYKIYGNSTEFIIDDKKYSINFIVPKDVFCSIKMSKLLMENLNLPFDASFKKLTLPPGRSTILKGVKNTTIIDSTYNATPDGVKAILQMFNDYPLKNKWLILGDMTELGIREKEEHEKLATIINSMDLEKITLIGPRVSKYTFPKLKNNANHFLLPKDGLNYLFKNIKGEETMLFKGARFLEGIIEHLLSNKNDIERLVRREKAWQNRRKAWGL